MFEKCFQQQDKTHNFLHTDGIVRPWSAIMYTYIVYVVHTDIPILPVNISLLSIYNVCKIIILVVLTAW